VRTGEQRGGCAARLQACGGMGRQCPRMRGLPQSAAGADNGKASADRSRSPFSGERRAPFRVSPGYERGTGWPSPGSPGHRRLCALKIWLRGFFNLLASPLSARTPSSLRESCAFRSPNQGRADRRGVAVSSTHFDATKGEHETTGKAVPRRRSRGDLSFTGLTDGRVPLASGSPVATKRWCNEFPGLIYSAGQAVTIAVSNVHRAMTGRLWKERA